MNKTYGKITSYGNRWLRGFHSRRVTHNNFHSLRIEALEQRCLLSVDMLSMNSEGLSFREVLSAASIFNTSNFTPATVEEVTKHNYGDGIIISGFTNPDFADTVKSTCNRNAADTTNTDVIWQGGSSGLNLTGQDCTIGIWDGGLVLNTHQELSGRVTLKDTGNFANHATHVAGTIGADGDVANARGMASGANIWSYDFADDLAELAADAGSLVVSGLSAFLCQSVWVGHFPVNSGIRSSNMTAKWFSADFQWWIGRVHFFDASLIAM
jgi:hypothetical protein